MASGVDLLGEHWAEDHNIPIQRYPADWYGFGKRAGPIRNIKMAANADALVAVWDGKSTGTYHMIQQAQRRNLRVHIHMVSP